MNRVYETIHIVVACRSKHSNPKCRLFHLGAFRREAFQLHWLLTNNLCLKLGSIFGELLPCMNRVCRNKNGLGQLVSSPGTKIACRLIDEPQRKRLQTDYKQVILFPRSVFMEFRLFVLLGERRRTIHACVVGDK